MRTLGANIENTIVLSELRDCLNFTEFNILINLLIQAFLQAGRSTLIYREFRHITISISNKSAMKKLSAILILFILMGSTSYGQSFKDRFLTSFGWGMHYGISPVTVKEYMSDNQTPVKVYAADQHGYVGLYDYAGSLRYNVYEGSENMAIGIELDPSLGMDFSNAGYLSFQMPLMIGFHTGAGSTYKASAEKGFYCAAGLNFMMNPLIKSDMDNGPGFKVKNSWMSPTVAAGYRYWSAKNRMKEISLRFATGPKGDAIPSTPPDDDQITSAKSVFYIGFSVKTFFNY